MVPNMTIIIKRGDGLGLATDSEGELVRIVLNIGCKFNYAGQEYSCNVPFIEEEPDIETIGNVCKRLIKAAEEAIVKLEIKN